MERVNDDDDGVGARADTKEGGDWLEASDGGEEDE